MIISAIWLKSHDCFRLLWWGLLRLWIGKIIGWGRSIFRGRCILIGGGFWGNWGRRWKGRGEIVRRKCHKLLRTSVVHKLKYSNKLSDNRMSAIMDIIGRSSRIWVGIIWLLGLYWTWWTLYTKSMRFPNKRTPSSWTGISNTSTQ